MMEKLWGSNYYDHKTKVWRFEPVSKDGTRILKRAFCEFILDPIIKVSKACLAGDLDTLTKMATRLGLSLSSQEWELTGKHLNRCFMQKWLNAADSIIDMVIDHLPSPKTA